MNLRNLSTLIDGKNLIGVNIHRSDEGWTCWTREKGSDGWARSGTHDTLEEAVNASLGKTTSPLDQEALDLL